MDNEFHLVCVQPFHGYDKGQMVTDPNEVQRLMTDRDHHFVRINPPVVEPEPEVEQEPEAAPVDEPVAALPPPSAS